MVKKHLKCCSALKLPLAFLALAGLAMPPSAGAQPLATAGSFEQQPEVTYADIATHADLAGVVAVVQVRSQAVVKPERAPGLKPGQARLYLQARTEALLGGRTALGESLAYLVDVPLMPTGKPPKLSKKRFIIFADSVPGRPGQLQLVGPSAAFESDEILVARVREVVAALSAPDAPPRIKALRDVISVPGNLAGESETQIFLETGDGAPVSVSVVRRPGMAPQWGVSWNEIVDQSATPPAPETVEWFRLACFLPEEIPPGAHLQSDRSARYQAAADYRFVLDQLGPCQRSTS